MAELSWKFLDDFSVARLLRPNPDWSAVDALRDAALRMLEDERGRFDARLAESNQKLRELGGDPLIEDWTRFRPLRLGREEDWSDWLAHLFERSKTGALARELLQPFAPDMPPVVAWQGLAGREQRTDDEHRTDIRFEPTGPSFHIEVKVGDRSFEKAFPTAEALERSDKRHWVHLILLPEADLGPWLKVEQEAKSQIRIHVIKWRDVARALRRTLVNRKESVSWRVWAWSFCGAVEQALLYHPVVPHTEPGPSIRSIHDLAKAVSVIRLLEEVGRDTA